MAARNSMVFILIKIVSLPVFSGDVSRREWFESFVNAEFVSKMVKGPSHYSGNAMARFHGLNLMSWLQVPPNRVLKFCKRKHPQIVFECNFLFST
jgi:hypothetical protein